MKVNLFRIFPIFLPTNFITFLFHFISYMTWFYCEVEIVNKFSSTDHILWHFFMGYYILSFILFQKTLLKVKSTIKIKHYWNYYKRFFSFSVKKKYCEKQNEFFLFGLSQQTKDCLATHYCKFKLFQMNANCSYSYVCKTKLLKTI